MKYANDITISVPDKRYSDTAIAEVKNLESWAANIKMSLKSVFVGNATE